MPGTLLSISHVLTHLLETELSVAGSCEIR